MVEKGYEIPIAILATTATGELGKWKRLGMDIVVNATWLAYYWAVEDGNDAAVSALETLILDWPFDFIRISGTTQDEIEENMFKFAVNYGARAERLRDFIGHRKSLLPPYLLHLGTTPLLATPSFFFREKQV